MELIHKSMDTAELLEAYRTLLPQVESLPLEITGNSMAPFLVHRRDTVWLCAIKRPLKVGDMVLYQRDNGSYILHRICKIQDGAYTMAGDAHSVTEPHIRRDQIFALVCQVNRKGTILTPDSFWWKFFANVWVRMIPLRPAALRAARILHRKGNE